MRGLTTESVLLNLGTTEGVWWLDISAYQLRNNVPPDSSTLLQQQQQQHAYNPEQ